MLSTVGINIGHHLKAGVLLVTVGHLGELWMLPHEMAVLSPLLLL